MAGSGHCQKPKFCNPPHGYTALTSTIADLPQREGFHDVVADVWEEALEKSGWRVIQKPSIRLIGPDNRVIGAPDMLAIDQNGRFCTIEIKTGFNPPLTPAQQFYIPILQIGGHIYSDDPRILKLGISPGQVFPPAAAIVIFAPGPGQKYEGGELPPPEFIPPK